MNTTRKRILAKFLPLLRKLLLQHSLPKVQHQHVTCCCTSKLNVLAHHCQMLPRFPIGSDVRSRKQSCTAEIHGLYVLSRGVVCSDAETFIPFTCPGMMSVLSRYSAVDVLLGVDSKQKVLDRGMGVLTVSLLAKTGLRNTRLQGTRQQIRACVTRGLPVLQAIIHAESSPNADRMFALLEQLWVETHGSGRPPLRDCVKQVHKDFAPAFESARLLHFPNSRPCDDYFHLRQEYRELDARLSQTHVENGCFVKTHLG